LQQTPFHAKHVALGAKLIPFAGYDMPVTYPTGLIAEHNAVRTKCGLFDVSHMGEFIVRGPQAVDFVNRVTTNDASKLAAGQIHYSGILNERGTFEDDCLVYRAADHVMMVVNASNAAKDLAHISKELGAFDATLTDESERTALLALQGPNAERVLSLRTAHCDLRTLKYYHFTTGTVAGAHCTISRTGYTGEDGFELYFDVKHASTVWDALMAGGDVTPCGLGCRDTLRLEAGMALYGNDIDDTVNPYEAGLGWIVKMGKGAFTGRDALDRVRVQGQGAGKRLVGFTIAERGAIPRHGFPVFVEGAPSGTVCSGTMSPTLGIAIGTCYVPASHIAEGSAIEIDIRGKRAIATVKKLPFYKRGQGSGFGVQ
jgi:aminomethyltransferase